MTTIRPAALSDTSWLLEQLKAFAQFYGTALSLFPSDDSAARAQVEGWIQTGPFFIAELRDGTRVGFIAGHLILHPLNQAVRVLAERFWWVAPQYRGHAAGARLLDAYMGFGRLNADMIVMTLEAKSPVDPASLERRGFRLHERSYLLEVSQA